MADGTGRTLAMTHTQVIGTLPIFLSFFLLFSGISIHDKIVSVK